MQFRTKIRSRRLMALATALAMMASLGLLACGSAAAQEAPGAGDPASVSITPVEDYNPIRTQHTLVAKVTDPAGDPVSGERVEWILNRAPALVGDVVSLSDSQVEDATAKKTDNTFGIGTTNDQGEARLTITATRAGDTDITALVPGIADTAVHKVFGVKHWVDIDADFPQDAVNVSGTKHVMSVQVSRLTDGEPLGGVPVRWDLIDNPQTGFFGKAAPGATSVVTSTDTNGAATVTLNQVTPGQGTNVVRMRVLAPDNPSFVLYSQEMTKTWQSSILGLTKDGPEQIGLLGDAEYTINVQNTGDGNATGVVLTDTIPEGMEYVSADPAASVSGKTVRWDIGEVATGETRPVKLVLKGIQAGPSTNRVEATSSEGVTASAEATTRVIPGELGITKTGPAEASLGQRINYRVNIENSGDGALTGVDLVDTIPEGMSYVSSSPSATVSGNQVNWTVGTLDSAATQSFTLVLRAETIGTWTNSARVSSSEAAAKLAEATTKVVQPVLDIQKNGPEQANLGEVFEYTITVRNQGDGAATAVTVSDTLPKGLSFVSASPDASVSDKTVTWNAGTLDSGASKTMDLTVLGNRSGVHENVVTVTSAQGSTDTARASTRILDPAVSIKKTGPSAVPSGFTRTYILSVTNTGETPLSDVTVTDEVPAGLSYESSVPSGDLANGEVSWNLGDLAVRQQKTISVVLRGEAAGTWTNVATVSTREGVNARDTLSVIVSEAFAGATMSLVDSIDPVATGEEVTYSIVVDNQAVSQDLHNMTIVAELPSQMSFVSATGPTSFSRSGQEVRFEPVGTVVPSGSLTYTVTVRANDAGSVLFTSTMRYDEFPAGPILVQEATTIFAP